MVYSVTAKLCEPDYKAEFKYLRTELAFVERKLAEKRSAFLRRLSVPGLGIFRYEDWRKYHHALELYQKQLKRYEEEVVLGVLPVKFGVYNDAERTDRLVDVRIQVQNGRVDDKRKPPARPERMDGGSGHGLKLVWPREGGFSRTKIKVSGHEVSAEFSVLGAHDGATLINQLVHVHCGPDTHVGYEVHSKNVAHERGEVTF
jgi:hypothetical protein